MRAFLIILIQGAIHDLPSQKYSLFFFFFFLGWWGGVIHDCLCLLVLHHTQFTAIFFSVLINGYGAHSYSFWTLMLGFNKMFMSFSLLLQVALDYIGKRGATVGVTREKRIKYVVSW